MADWKQKCDAEWNLAAHGVPLPDDVDWKSVYEKKPLERNLLKNPSPYGMVVVTSLHSFSTEWNLHCCVYTVSLIRLLLRN